MKKFILLICALVLGAPAKADPVRDDVRCFIVALQAMDSSDAATKMAGTMAQNYWMGRIDGHQPEIDLENMVLAEIPEVSKPGVFESEALRCGTEMQVRGAEVQKIGRNIQRRAMEMMHGEQLH